MDLMQYVVIFGLGLAVFRAIAELLIGLSPFLKNEALGSFGKKMSGIAEFLGGILGRFGYGSPSGLLKK